MAAILRDPVVAVVVRTRPRAIPLAMIAMGKSIHGFSFLSYIGMGLRFVALRPAGAPLLTYQASLPNSGKVSLGTPLNKREAVLVLQFNL